SSSPGAAVRPSLDGIAQLLPTPRATDGEKGGPNQRGSKGDLMLPSAVQLLPTPSTADGLGGHERRGGTRSDELLLGGLVKSDQFGQYGPAVGRWTEVLGRPAPDPTIPGRNNGRRLNPRFVEWMMGLPAGWVTDVPGLTRAAQLKALGNGVVPQQAAAAIATMLGLEEEETAAPPAASQVTAAAALPGQLDLFDLEDEGGIGPWKFVGPRTRPSHPGTCSRGGTRPCAPRSGPTCGSRRRADRPAGQRKSARRAPSGSSASSTHSPRTNS